MLRESILSRNSTSKLFDVRTVITRKKIDDAQIPVLFVELENGQNGTLTPFPGKGVGTTWLGADGITITLNYGVLKATRGMKNDIMGSKSSMPKWSDLSKSSEYTRYISYLDGNNQLYSKKFSCKIKSHTKQVLIKIFDVPFKTLKYSEVCTKNKKIQFTNTYFIDKNKIVRRSFQYHGSALGYITLERLER